MIDKVTAADQCNHLSLQIDSTTVVDFPDPGGDIKLLILIY